MIDYSKSWSSSQSGSNCCRSSYPWPTPANTIGRPVAKAIESPAPPLASVSNFVSTTDPSRMYIGELVKNGEERYVDWKKRTQSLAYVFREESESLFKDHQMDEVFDCSKGHPIILKKFLGGNISLETLVIYDRILGYGKDFDKKLKDPVWETVSKRVRKYTPFLNIDVFRYKKILKEVVISGT